MQDYFFIIPISVFLLAGVMSPGPSFLLVAHTAMSKSRREALAVSLGMGVGATVFSVIACVGLFIVLENIKWLYLILKLSGASYLIYLAIKMWQNAGNPVVTNTPQKGTGVVSMFLVGVFTQLSNPKTAIVFASAFATFLPQNMPEYSYTLISSAAFLIDTTWYAIVAICLSTEKAQTTFRKLKKHICRFSSALMGFMGIKLLASN